MTDFRERLFIVTYDVADAKRLRRVFKCMKGYGEWIQYSVFQCRLTDMDRAELVSDLAEIINHSEDHVILIDICAADKIKPKVTSLGKPYNPPVREAIVI